MDICTLAPSPWLYVRDNAGNIVPQGQVEVFYAEQPGVHAPTYTDADGAVENPNPIIADDFGVFVAYLIPGTAYKWVEYDAQGEQIRERDNIMGVPLTAPPTEINGIDQGRPTYESGVPVTDSDLQNQATVYYTPYNGNSIALFDNVAGVWRLYTFSELSYDISGLTASAGYDFFVYLDGTTLRLEALIWTDPMVVPTRGNQNGVPTKLGDPTRRLVFSLLMTAVAGRGADTYNFRGLSSLNNPVARSLLHFGQNSWAYTLNVLRQADADVANQVTVFCCVAGRAVALQVSVTASNTNAAVPRRVAIGLNSTTVVATGCLYQGTYGAANDVLGLEASYQRLLAGGKAVLAWLEESQAVGTTTFVGADSFTQNGISGTVIA